MKIQRNIIYLTVVTSLISLLVYAYCVFGWDLTKCESATKWNTYISNIVLGIWGSSIISLIMSVVSYGECRRKELERFMRARRELFEHCRKYTEDNSVTWFEQYINMHHELSDSWSDIWFLFDPRKHRLYLKDCVDYYADFIQLVQDKYYLLSQPINDKAKQELLNEIDEIVIRKRVINQGILRYCINENNFTNDMEMVIKNIYDIYCRKGTFKKFIFNKTLLNEHNFKILDDKFEKYVKNIIRKIDKANTTEIEFVMPITDAEYLVEVGYFHGFTHGNNGMTSKINCKFILDHYFDMKERAVIKVDNKNNID